MVMFSRDTVMFPKESAHFGFYKAGQETKIENLRDSKIYKEDRLGLAKLDKQHKLHFLTVDGDHLQFSYNFFIEKIIPFLN